MPDNNISDEYFFQQEVERGLTTSLWPEMLRIHRNASRTVQQLGCSTVLELGAGIGAFLLGCNSVGMVATGIDKNSFARDFAISKGVSPEQYLLDDFQSVRLQNQYDCIVSIECFEHCSDQELDPLCKQLAKHCSWFYFSSTPYPSPNDAEWGHINLKTKDTWIAFFRTYELKFVREDRSIVDWGLIFESALS